MTFAHKQAKEDNSNINDVTKDDSSSGDEISITDRILRCISENRIKEPKRRRDKNCEKNISFSLASWDHTTMGYYIQY